MKVRIISSVITAVCMAMIMSFVQAYFNVGFSDIFIKTWLRSWRIGAIVAIPVSYFLPPNVAVLVNRYVG